MRVVNEILGEAVTQPFPSTMFAAGTTSLIVGIALHAIGHTIRTTPLTAMFIIGGGLCLSLATISTVAFAIIAYGIYRGNERAFNDFQ